MTESLHIPDPAPVADDNPWFNSQQDGADAPQVHEPPRSVPFEPPDDKPKNPPKRGGPRKLLKKDIEQIENMYVYTAMAVQLIRPKAADAMLAAKTECAKAWADLAEQDPKVRRAILLMLEGGAWSAVVMAHAPILLTLVPENALERMPLLFGQEPDDAEGG